MKKIELCQLGFISLYENVTSPTPIGSIGINVLHGLIERGGKNGKIQRGIEQLRSINDKERSKIKRTLPAVTVSGTFAARANTGITSHSGLLQIDIDYNGNEQLIDRHGGAVGVAGLVSAYPHALLTCVSPSGNGVKSIVRIELQSILKRLPIDLAAAHALAAEKVSADYLDLFGLIVDSAGSRMAQAMIIPFDPNVCYTPNGTPATADDSSIQAHIDMLATRAKARAAAASMAKARNAGGTGIERYYCKAVDNVLRDLATAEQGEKHNTAVISALQLQSLISGAAMLGVNLHDCEGAFLSIYQLIGGAEKKAAAIWHWAQARTIEPRLPHDSTGYVGNVVSVSGVGAFRVLSAWQKTADTLLLTLENGIQIPANLCQVIGR